MVCRSAKRFRWRFSFIIRRQCNLKRTRLRACPHLGAFCRLSNSIKIVIVSKPSLKIGTQCVAKKDKENRSLNGDTNEYSNKHRSQYRRRRKIL